MKRNNTKKQTYQTRSNNKESWVRHNLEEKFKTSRRKQRRNTATLDALAEPKQEAGHLLLRIHHRPEEILLLS